MLGSFLAIFAINIVTVTPSNDLVSDRITINTSPEQVWQYVVSFPRIETEPDYWLFRIGLPSPVQSIAEGNYVGASRQCIFSNGAIFQEKIVELEPGAKLTFEITEQPNDPEIIGHLNLLKGQFLLQDNGDGTTTLIGNSWYDLKVKPSQYFDIWTRSIIRNVHMEVMEHIKELAESA
ncbi:SRPBCC family protein [Cohnella yongneupensis]|uniref:SRPBCC family protein n=1 Tax=Cohnella yongneupensis TaxID=425006 RepID=A0ABW0QUQ9_9BACL